MQNFMDIAIDTPLHPPVFVDNKRSFYPGVIEVEKNYGAFPPLSPQAAYYAAQLYKQETVQRRDGKRFQVGENLITIFLTYAWIARMRKMGIGHEAVLAQNKAAFFNGEDPLGTHLISGAMIGEEKHGWTPSIYAFSGIGSDAFQEGGFKFKWVDFINSPELQADIYHKPIRIRLLNSTRYVAEILGIDPIYFLKAIAEQNTPAQIWYQVAKQMKEDFNIEMGDNGRFAAGMYVNKNIQPIGYGPSIPEPAVGPTVTGE